MNRVNLKNRKSLINNMSNMSNMNNIFYMLLIIFLVFAIGFLINYLMGNKPSDSYEGLENKKVQLFYYWMDGCGHCKNFNVEWDKFAEINMQNPKLNVLKVQNTDSNIPTKHEKLIEGYPTVLLEKKNGEIIIYAGDRTETALSDWVKNYM